MDSVKEYGQEVITTEKGHRIGIVTIIGETKDTRFWLQMLRQLNMNI